jgi:general L-amino acid transport system substrate-binding protein
MTRPVRLSIGLVAFALIIAACTTPPAASPTEVAQATAPPAETPVPTPAPPIEGGQLAAVQERGQLICGVNGALPGWSVLDEATGDITGFDADYCRAVAAAVLGDPEAVEYRVLNTDQRSTALQAREIDVLIRNTTWTVTRDATWGLFAPTTFYDGQAMMVRADVGAETLEDLEGATVCVQSGTTTELNLTDRMRELGVTIETVVFPEIDPTYEAYEGGNCDAVTSDRSQLVARRSVFETPDDHVILDEVMSKEPLGPVVPLGDDQWFNVVKWVVNVTIEAEELGITQANVEDEAATSENPVVRRLLGAEGDLGTLLGLENDWVIGVISAVGNYGEIYDRNLGPDTPIGLERGLNNLWTEDGLLYSPPYR